MRNEVDPNGLSAKAPGSKLDSGKAPIAKGVLQYFPNALIEIAKVSLKGAEKYSWKGWEKVDDGFNRYSDALARHLLAESTEGLYDNGPGGTDLLHASQVAWNSLARLELLLRDLAKKKPGQIISVPASMDPARFAFCQADATGQP
jgi:hypothetical protein